MIEIKNRFSGSVILTATNFDTIQEAAVAAGYNLARANLTEANLAGFNLTRANLTRANLTEANLTRANFTRANLTRANLTEAYLADANLTGAYLARAYLAGADLTDANLTRAYLAGANFTRADLTRADLTCANFTRADLTDAYLEGADLKKIQKDFFAVLALCPAEISGLALALQEGRVDGSTYSSDCACLVGTIANIRGCNFKNVVKLKPNSNRAAERWFMGIANGQTEKTNQIVAITLRWIEEFKAKY